jgi:hypothetical protein
MTPAPTRIVNRGRNHSYVLDGQPCPGVTAILGDAIPKPGLVHWSARTVAEYVFDRLATCNGHPRDYVSADELIADLRAYNETRTKPERLGDGLPRVGLSKVLATVQYAARDEAANRGTEVHRLAELLGRGEEVEVPEPLAGHVNAYLAFLEEWNPTDAVLERVVINRRVRYMGRLDLIVTLPTISVPGFGWWGGRTLLDIKTSRSAPYGDTALQLAAYRYAETILGDDGDEAPMEDVESAGVVWVRADGYDVFPFEAGPKTFRVFEYARQIAAYVNEKDGPVNDARGPALTAPALEPAP